MIMVANFEYIFFYFTWFLFKLLDKSLNFKECSKPLRVMDKSLWGSLKSPVLNRVKVKKNGNFYQLQDYSALARGLNVDKIE